MNLILPKFSFSINLYESFYVLLPRKVVYDDKITIIKYLTLLKGIMATYIKIYYSISLDSSLNKKLKLDINVFLKKNRVNVANICRFSYEM